MKVVLAVKDLALGSFLPPFTVPAVGVAVRQFGDEVKSSDSPLSKHPEDYELWRLAMFDEDKGSFHESVERVARGVDYIKGE